MFPEDSLQLWHVTLQLSFPISTEKAKGARGPLKMPPGQDNGALVVSSSCKVFRASFLILPRKYAGISFVNSNKFLTYLWEDEMPRSEEASARPSELVNCPSSLSPWIWLLRTRAGPQAANASSGNPSQNVDPSWCQQQAQAQASLHSLKENGTAGIETLLGLH